VATVWNSLGDRIVRQKTWSPYLGVEYSSRDYTFIIDEKALDPQDQSLKGSSSSANVIGGLDYYLNRHCEANMELSYTILPFGGSDTRVKIRWMLVSFGFNYVF
jgi:outer membrane protein W